MGIMKAAMKVDLRTVAVLTLTAIITLTVAACVAHCAPTTKASHDCCPSTTTTDNASKSAPDACSLCSLSLTSRPDTGKVALRIAEQCHRAQWIPSSHGPCHTDHRLDLGRLPRSAEPEIDTNGLVSKRYLQLVSYLYFELT